MDRNQVMQGVPERRLTRWHNPTPNAMTVVIRDGNPFAFTVAAGETKELDSVYDHAVQMVDCGKDECHKKGWFCRAGHQGQVVGGGAPLLKRVGKTDSLDPSLDPEAAKLKEVRAELDREQEREILMIREREKREQAAKERAAQAPAAAPAQAAPTAAPKR
jgi:hypothetical protein